MATKDKNKNNPDLKTMKDSLGMVVSCYTYIADNLGYLKETDVVMRFVISMLDAQGKLDKPLDQKGLTYRKIFKKLRRDWGHALLLWNAKSGEWRESWIKCSEVLDMTLRIAVKENLLNVTPEMLNLSRVGGMRGDMAGLPMMDAPRSPEDLE